MINLTICNKYRIQRKIGSGSFGEIYLATDISTGKEVAVKLERANSRYPQLVYESNIIRILKGANGFPTVFWNGTEGLYNAMVIDLLGPSLEELFIFCNRKFTLKTALMLGEQMLSRTELLHSKHIVHRDLKPDNFLIGLGKRANLLYLIDFGLARRYRDPKNFKHIPKKEGKTLIGTARYASIFTHLGVEQSRRDDLEAIGYILLYFLKGSLPWQGLPATERHEKYRKIRDRKINTPIDVVCRGCPSQFIAFITYCRTLEFADQPDYAYLKRLLSDALVQGNYDNDSVFDWELRDYTLTLRTTASRTQGNRQTNRKPQRTTSEGPAIVKEVDASKKKKCQIF